MAVTPTRALMHQAQSRPETAAFIFREDVWTYRRLADEAGRVARSAWPRGDGRQGRRPGRASYEE